LTSNSQESIHKALISFVVEHVLLDVGKPELDDVGNRLYKKYQCYFSDCYNHPEYLREILYEIFGDGYHSITEKIQKRLADLEQEIPIDNFIKVLCK